MDRETRIQMLESELSVVKLQNDRLNQENSLLHEKLNRLTTTHRSTAAINVDAKLKAFQLEDERDQMWQNLEKLKKKYNHLHDAYCEKVKRCKILESTFQRQKTLTGLVMKSAIKQRNEEQKLAGACSNENELELKLKKLQNDLSEAYDIIDELEFELETIDLLEMENKRVHDELAALKIKYDDIKKSLSSSQVTPVEAPPAYSEVDAAVVSDSSEEQEFDSKAVDRAVLTESFLKSAEAESDALRR